ncbi:MAG: DUF1778 domain-containing protein [Proteobacteria bacterium]|nr:DUF1778 domain-containing protein [Pseudomonadota bacterium]
MAKTSTRSARIEARISPEALSIVRRAAEIQGRSISDFVVAAAQDAAERTVWQTEIIRLSVKHQEQFYGALRNPKPPNAALKRAFAKHRKLIRESK